MNSLETLDQELLIRTHMASEVQPKLFRRTPGIPKLLKDVEQL